VSGVDRLLLAAAVAVSPAAHRAVRREQWTADVRDAHELDLSPTALAFGALTTALFHRRAGHRSTWGETMTAAPFHVRATPHTIRTVPVLVALAVVSFLASSVVLSLLQRYNGLAAAMPLFTLVGVGLALVPGAAVASALLLVARVALRRRVLGAVAAMAVAFAWWGLVNGSLNLPVWPGLTLGLIASAWLAVWLVVVGRPRWTLTLLVLPVVAAVIMFPLTNALISSGLAYSVMTFVSWTGQLVPFLVAILAAIVAGRFSTDQDTGFVAAEEALVDKSA
jgi:hypothetical protein